MPNSQEVKTSPSMCACACVCVWSLIALNKVTSLLLQGRRIAIGFIILEDGSVKKEALKKQNKTKKVKVMLH